MKTRNVLVVVCLCVLAATGCGSSEAGATLGQSKIDRAWAEFDKVVDRPGVSLTTRGLPAPPKGYTDAEQAQFARQVLQVMKRSLEPGLSGLPQAAARSRVLDVLYPGTVKQFRADVTKTFGRHDWTWAVASRYPSAPVRPPVVLKSEWANRLLPPTKWEDGTTHHALQVVLRVYVRQDVTVEGRTHPVVVMREFGLGGYEPLGGPDWWSSLRWGAGTYGADTCVLDKTSRLTPGTDPEEVSKSARDLEKELAEHLDLVRRDTTSKEADKTLGDMCAS